MANNKKINPISNVIINFLLEKEIIIFSNLFLIISPIFYWLINKIPNESVKQWIFVVYTLILVITSTIFVGILIKEYIDDESRNHSTEKLGKKAFFEQYGLITLPDMLKYKEKALSEGDKVIIYTSKLETESIVTGEDGETFDLQQIVKTNRENNVEYYILYYIGVEDEEKMNNYKKMYNKLIQIESSENNIDYQLSLDKRTGFDLIFFYHKADSSVEAFFCVNYITYAECQTIRTCDNRCREIGEKNNNSHLLYKRLRGKEAAEIYNTDLSKLVYGESADAHPRANPVEEENYFGIDKYFPIILYNYFLPVLGNIAAYKLNVSLISGIVLCFVMYFYLVIFFIRKDIFGLISPNRFPIKNLLKDYRLKLKKEMNKIEMLFRRKDKDDIESDKRVCVFSYDLSTEVLKDKSQEIVRRNIKSGVKYEEFYCTNDNNKNKTLDRSNDFKKYIGKKHEEKITFIPLENKGGEKNIIPSLLGSISFHKDETETAYFKEHSYFSLRGGTNEVIYFKMPGCMSEQYYYYFHSRKKEFEEKTKKESEQ